jgi:hypothetical protein
MLQFQVVKIQVVHIQVVQIQVVLLVLLAKAPTLDRHWSWFNCPTKGGYVVTHLADSNDTTAGTRGSRAGDSDGESMRSASPPSSSDI